MKTEKTIRVDDRVAIFIKLIGLLWQYDGEGVKNIAFNAGVHYTTLYNWRVGKTRAPRIDTVVKVANELGYAVELVPTNKRKLRVIK